MANGTQDFLANLVGGFGEEYAKQNEIKQREAMLDKQAERELSTRKSAMVAEAELDPQKSIYLRIRKKEDAGMNLSPNEQNFMEQFYNSGKLKYINDIIKSDLYNRYNKGDRSADVLAGLGMGSKIISENDPRIQKLEEDKKTKTIATQNFKDSASDMLNTIGEVEKGINNFGALGQVPTINPWDYNRKEWESNVKKLLSEKIINLMNNMKQASKTGATGFGALSQKELSVLQDASTALNRGLSPDQAQKYLNDMKYKLQKILDNNVTSENNNKLLDNTNDQNQESKSYSSLWQ